MHYHFTYYVLCMKIEFEQIITADSHTARCVARKRNPYFQKRYVSASNYASNIELQTVHSTF